MATEKVPSERDDGIRNGHAATFAQTHVLPVACE